MTISFTARPQLRPAQARMGQFLPACSLFTPAPLTLASLGTSADSSPTFAIQIIDKQPVLFSGELFSRMSGVLLDQTTPSKEPHHDN